MIFVKCLPSSVVSIQLYKASTQLFTIKLYCWQFLFSCWQFPLSCWQFPLSCWHFSLRCWQFPLRCWQFHLVVDSFHSVVDSFHSVDISFHTTNQGLLINLSFLSVDQSSTAIHWFQPIESMKSAGYNDIEIFQIWLDLHNFTLIYYKLSYCLFVCGFVGLCVTELLPNEGSNLN